MRRGLDPQRVLARRARARRVHRRARRAALPERRAELALDRPSPGSPVRSIGAGLLQTVGRDRRLVSPRRPAHHAAARGRLDGRARCSASSPASRSSGSAPRSSSTRSDRGRVAIRHDVQRSWIVRKLDAALPPSRSTPCSRQSTRSRRSPARRRRRCRRRSACCATTRIRSSLTRVVKVLGTACGEGVEGSGWFARRDLVVTAAHVVAGERSTVVEIPGDAGRIRRNRRRLRRPQRHRRSPHRGRDRAVRCAWRIHRTEPRSRSSATRSTGTSRRSPAASGAPRTRSRRTRSARGPVERAITAVAGRVQQGRLRRPGDRHARRRRGDDLRQEEGLAERLRRPGLDHPHRPRERRPARRVDRRPARPSRSGSSSTTLSGWRNGATT